ncbi:MAG: ABC transporter permease [Verrucomicrobia bacterium]|nr:MAG: ABC transporter permease [Verrucomicrobiota bacterium]
MWERVLQILRKEFKIVFRDPRMRLVIFGVPVIQCLIFGYAVTMDVRDARLVVMDLDNTPASREVVSAFLGSPYFRAVGWTRDWAEARHRLDAAETSGVLRINSGFGEALGAGRPAPVQLILDGSDSNTASLILGYSRQVVARISGVVLEARAGATAGRVGPGVELRERAWFNADLTSRNYFVPGIMAVLVMLVTLMLTSMAIVREKEVGTIEQVMVTPIRRSEFILGKSLPFAVIGLVDVGLVTVVGVGWFGIPIRGSFALLLLGMGLFILSTLGIGLFISTVSSTQQQAMMTTFFFFFPAMLLSGFVYPIDSMPEPVQWVTLANPLRHVLVVIRGIFLKGVGADVLWPQLVALLLIGVLVQLFAISRFRKRVV